MKNTKKKKKSKNIIGISLGILLLIFTIIFLVLLKMVNIIPDKYLLVGSIIVLLITLIILS